MWYQDIINNIILRDYKDFTLIYNISTNTYAMVDETAGKIIKYVRDNQLTHIDDVVDYLKTQYSNENDIQTKDIEDFFDSLYKAGILESYTHPIPKAANTDTDNGIEAKIMNYMLSKRQLFSATIEMTYKCNEHCIHCYAYDGQFNKETLLTTQKIKELIDELYELNCFHIVFTGGDPFMRPDFVEVFEYARQKNFSVDIYTNGLMLSDNEDIFNRIIAGHPKGVYISLYSSNSDIHDKITTTKGSWNKTIDAIKKLHNANISVILNFNVMKDTYSTLEQTVALAKLLGVDYRIGWSLTETNTGNDEPLKYVLDDENQAISAMKIAGAKKRIVDIEQEIKKDDYICGAGITSLAITPNGDIKPCVSLNINFGNVKQDTIKDVFYGQVMTKFVKNIIWENTEKCKDCELMNICHHCVANSYNQNGSVFADNEQDCFFARCIKKALNEK